MSDETPIDTPEELETTRTVATQQVEAEKPRATDVFLWANQTDAVKNDLQIELFLFNKHYTPYMMRFASELEQQIRALFLYDIINDINLGAGTGLSVRDYEMSEAGEDILLRTERDKVERAGYLFHLIEAQRDEIVEFNEEEHEFKRMKGVVARFSSPQRKNAPFYIIKALQQSSALKGATSWEINGGRFDQFKADVGLKIPNDNQVLVVDNDIFIFNQTKFEKLLEYDYKRQLVADAKIKEIEALYKLSFAEGMDIQTLIKDKPGLARKLEKLEIGEVPQDKALDYADTMQLDLMTDDANRIIIMDGRDLDMFVNLINEDYITSEITGKRYVIKSKKLLDQPDGEPPRG